MSHLQGDYLSIVQPLGDTAKPARLPRASVNAPTLSCELCRQRKVKCDKGSPCSTCQRAGVSCVAIKRPRLPRGRNGGRPPGDNELRARVAKLESLVKSLESSVSREKRYERSRILRLYL